MPEDRLASTSKEFELSVPLNELPFESPFELKAEGTTFNGAVIFNKVATNVSMFVYSRTPGPIEIEYEDNHIPIASSVRLTMLKN